MAKMKNSDLEGITIEQVDLSRDTGNMSVVSSVKSTTKKRKTSPKSIYEN